jgi:hypothetical protein
MSILFLIKQTFPIVDKPIIISKCGKLDQNSTISKCNGKENYFNCMTMVNATDSYKKFL